MSRNLASKVARGAVALIAVSSIALLASCAPKSKALKVGATPVPHAVLLNLVKDDLKAKGVELEVVEFTDYVTPNVALAEKQLDANFFQHVPYLESFAAERKLELESAGTVHVEPLGLYSKKFKSAEELPAGATIGIPNDPTNEGRALILLAKFNLITLKADSGLTATPASIESNPKNFQFKELEAAQLPRTLEDVDASVINGNYALESGLKPTADALVLEGADSPYANIVAVRKGGAADKRIIALMEALRSPKVKEYIDANYGGGVVAAF